MYYETYGTGAPLVLLHGAFMTIDMAFGSLIPELAKTRRVVAVELQGHGRTADIDRPFSFEAMADDVAGLFAFLKIDRADVLGYSMGGGVAMNLAIRHPRTVRKLVVISEAFKYGGWSPETRAVFSQIRPEFFDGTPLRTEYDRLAPNPKRWSRMIEKMVAFITTPYDYTEKVKTLESPVLLILGDSDGLTTEHAAEMFKLVGGGGSGDLGTAGDSRWAVLPAASHTGVMMRTDALLGMIPPFLDAPVKSAR